MMPENLDTLQQTLATELFRDGEQAWLLFDALHLDVADCLDDIPAEDIYNISLDREDIPPAREAKLISITSHQVERIRQSLAFALEEQSDAAQEERQGFAIGGWLASNASVKQLTAHLSRCMSQRIPGEGRRYFRWADRRVTEWMWPALDETEKASLLGPVSQWWTLDRVNELRQAAAIAQANETKKLAWHLTPALMVTATSCEHAQLLMREVFDHTNLPENYLDRVKHALSSVSACELSDPAENILLATLLLEVHSNLLAHPLVMQAIQKAKRQHLPLLKVLDAGIPPTDWQLIKRQLEAEPGKLTVQQGV